MEVLDPDQNNESSTTTSMPATTCPHVMFIATANVLPPSRAPLQDRMEIIRLSGFTQREKAEIARRHLVSMQIAYHGLRDNQLEITDDALERVIEEYTREAGVRNLEREIARVSRKGARALIEQYSTEIAKAAEEAAALQDEERALAVADDGIESPALEAISDGRERRHGRARGDHPGVRGRRLRRRRRRRP